MRTTTRAAIDFLLGMNAGLAIMTAHPNYYIFWVVCFGTMQLADWYGNKKTKK